MAWIFSLSAECGPSREAAEAFASHFSQAPGPEFEPEPDRPGAQTGSHIFQDDEGNWWCRVSSERFDHVDEVSPEMAYELTAFGLLLYHRLKKAPSFRYALAGIEVDEFRTHGELLSDDANACDLPAGLVLVRELWQQLGSPVGFRPFKPGYLWIPYGGEVYSPLASSVELTESLERLLAG